MSEGPSPLSLFDEGGWGRPPGPSHGPTDCVLTRYGVKISLRLRASPPTQVEFSSRGRHRSPDYTQGHGPPGGIRVSPGQGLCHVESPFQMEGDTGRRSRGSPKTLPERIPSVSSRKVRGVIETEWRVSPHDRQGWEGAGRRLTTLDLKRRRLLKGFKTV